jgi:hypothetical protein
MCRQRLEPGIDDEAMTQAIDVSTPAQVVPACEVYRSPCSRARIRLWRRSG